MTLKNTEITKALKKAKKIAKDLQKENPHTLYLREVLRQLRKVLNVSSVLPKYNKLPHVPTEEEIQKYYKAVWQSRNMKHVVLLKILLYTGIRVSELINIKIEHIDFEKCQIKITKKDPKKGRIVPFPHLFKEVLAMHVETIKAKKGVYLFESSLRKPYSDRGIRKILAMYTKASGMKEAISPLKLRHFLFTWMKKQGIQDAFIQSYSGHEHLHSLEIYRKISLKEGQESYNEVINKFPI